jgi:hypothetical protein
MALAVVRPHKDVLDAVVVDDFIGLRTGDVEVHQPADLVARSDGRRVQPVGNRRGVDHPVRLAVGGPSIEVGDYRRNRRAAPAAGSRESWRWPAASCSPCTRSEDPGCCDSGGSDSRFRHCRGELHANSSSFRVVPLFRAARSSLNTSSYRTTFPIPTRAQLKHHHLAKSRIQRRYLRECPKPSPTVGLHV